VKHSLTDRVEVVTHRGTVRLLVGDLAHPDEDSHQGPSTLVMSPTHARLLAKELEDAALVAESDDREASRRGPTLDARRMCEAQAAMLALHQEEES